jgi:hypothetical protein
LELYPAIRAGLSVKNRGRFSKFLILSGIKPSINNKVKSPLTSGTIVFSVDFEMAWAFRYSRELSATAIEVGLKERENVPLLLNLLDDFTIPATWATVGHLFLDCCSPLAQGPKHPEMLRPEYFDNRNWIYNSGDWYDHDPATNELKDPAWYASTLVEKIISAKTKHEIGCHTFSHLDFTYKNCPKNIADNELEQKGDPIEKFRFPGRDFW